MQNANRSLDRYGKNFEKIGKKLSVNLTAPILGLGGLAVATAAKFETLQTALTTSFNGSEEAANKAFDSITKFSSKTPFQVEEVANAFIKLKNLGLDPSERALTSYGNTASAMGKTLNDVVEAVADASTGEFERLKEFGIRAASQGDQVTFTFKGVSQTVQKESAAIQEYLLNIGETDFAGGIEAQSKTFTGRLSTLKDNVAFLFKDFGDIIIEYLGPLVEKLQSMTARFRELSPTTKKWLVILGGISAAIGPLLALSGTILPAIGTGLALLTGPIGLIVAGLTAVGVIIYKNWAPIKQALIDIANYFIDLYNESTVFRIGVEYVIMAFKNLFQVGKFIFEGLKSILGGFVDQFVTNFKTVGELIKAVFTGNLKAIPGIVKDAVNQSKNNFKDLTSNLGTDFKNLTEGIKGNINEAIDAVTTRKKIAFIKNNVDATAVEEKVAEAVQNGITKGASGTGGGRGKTKALDTTGLAQGGTNFAPGLSGISGQLKGLTEPVDEALIAFQSRLLDFQDATQNIMQGVAENFVSGFADIVAGIAQGTVGFGAVGALLLSTLGDLATQIGKAAVKIGITMKAVKLSFANPLTAIAAGSGLIIVGQLLKGLAGKFSGGGSGGLTPFANGGLVYGPTAALVGEYAGASNNPEVIAPLDKLKTLIAPSQGGTQVFIPDVKLKGADLYVSFTRYNELKTRRGS